MRVAHLGNYKPESASGVDKTIVGLVRHLGGHGVEAEVWHPTAGVERVRERREDGVPVFDVPIRDSRWKNVLGPPRPTDRFLTERARAVDLVHVHSVFIPHNLWVGRLGVPYLITPNGGYSPEVLAGHNRLLKRVWIPLRERPFVNRARAVHAVSPPEVGHLEGFGVRVPVTMIPNGIDEALLAIPQPPPSSGSRLTFLGRLAVDHKGLDLLLEGYARALAEVPSLPGLTLIGSDFRGGREHLERLAARLGIAGRVAFPGPVFGEAKWEELGRARVFLHTSRWEGMPFAVLEALAMGRPLLITPQTNLADYVERHGAGWVVEGDPDAIARGLLAVAEATPEELDARGAAARELVREELTWASVAERMADLYRRTLREQSPDR